MPAKSAVVPDVKEEENSEITTPQGNEPEIVQDQPPQPLTGRLGEIMNLMAKDMPPELRESLRLETKEEPKAEEAVAEPEEETEVVEPEKTEEEAPEGELPSWVKPRLSKAKEQRDAARAEAESERTAREKAESEVAELRSRIAQPPVLPATDSNPLANIHDLRTLDKTEADIEELLAWTERNRNGADEVEIGKDANGKPILKSFDEEQVTDMRIKAEKWLRKSVPTRREFIAAKTQADTIAAQEFPETFDGKSEASLLASKVQQMVPAFAQFPDGNLHLALYVKALMEYQKSKAAPATNGKHPPEVSDRIKPFVKPQAKKAPVLPSVEYSRSTAPADADFEEAQKRVVATAGSPQAIEELVGTILDRGKRGRRDRRQVA